MDALATAAAIAKVTSQFAAEMLYTPTTVSIDGDYACFSSPGGTLNYYVGRLTSRGLKKNSVRFR